ncbi:hypothetical protein HK405_012582 [Cladochytrium tenue]|nr:hypothetical protein HK405_012582 [Cladochytrium tenue]
MPAPDSRDAVEPPAVEEEPGAGHEGQEAWTVVAACFVLFVTTVGGLYTCKRLLIRLAI